MRGFIIVVTIIHSCIISKAQDKIQFAKSNEEKATETNLKCGVTNPSGLVFRFGEMLADFGEYPWMVAIIKKSDTPSTQWSDKDYLNGGTLIHTSVVLTSSYGLEKIKPNEIKCRAGEWHKTAEDEDYVHQERNVRRIVIHKDYFKDSFYNAISMVFLEQPFDLNDAPHVGVACVGPTLPEPGTKCFGTGWGMSAVSGKSDILKKIPVNLLSADDCETKMRKTRLGKIYRLHDSLTCAGSADDTCKGDLGAPLVCPVKDDSTRYVLYGMSAFRIHEEGAPCIYVKVPAFYDWIGERMGEEGFNSSTYTYVP
uniref:Serine protease n=1 Tax=Papilio xuthus TaxID=66420 RepID=I4DLJ1_PAPXU|nr:serine protease [Papilio xuthus]